MGGGLAPLSSVRVEAVPRAFAIDPSGRFILVAGLDCNRLGVYAVSEAGTLSKLTDCPAGSAPSWIEIVGLTGP